MSTHPLAAGVPLLAAGRARRRRRALRSTALLVSLTVAVAVAALCLGAYAVAPPDVARALAGRGDAGDLFVVRELRLPRLVLGLLVGAALGAAGALFQTALRNPLAAPDVVGVTWGSSVAAVYALIVLGLSGAAVSLAAFLGGLAATAAIGALAWRGGLAGHRFVLTGVAVAALAAALLNYLLTRSDVRDARTALVWLVGSVGSARWGEIAVIALALGVLLPAGFLVARPLRALALGDPLAAGLGVRVTRARTAVIVTGVALASVATAAAGPVAFVALVAPAIARSLAGDDGPALGASVLAGMLLVAGADLAALHLVPGGTQVPVGVVTGAVGAPYLLWLLATEGRRGRR